MNGYGYGHGYGYGQGFSAHPSPGYGYGAFVGAAGFYRPTGLCPYPTRLEHSSGSAVPQPATSATAAASAAASHLFDPSLLSEAADAQPGDGYTVRPLARSDYAAGHCGVLADLTDVGDMDAATWAEVFDEMAADGKYYVVVVEEDATGMVVASGTLVVGAPAPATSRTLSSSRPPAASRSAVSSSSSSRHFRSSQAVTRPSSTALTRLSAFTASSALKSRATLWPPTTTTEHGDHTDLADCFKIASPSGTSPMARQA